MATKSANLYARIEPDVKEQAEGILAALGIPASNAINMFYKQIILQRGLPFEVKMPSARPVDVSALSEAQMNAELEKGYADMQAGHTRSAKSVFVNLFNCVFTSRPPYITRIIVTTCVSSSGIYRIR